MKVLNTLGSVVMEVNNIPVSGKYSKTVDLSKMAEGIYFLKVDGDSGMIIRKIVVER